MPRVTEVLKPFTGFEHVPQKILENAVVRGSTVHSLCSNIAEGAWIPDNVIEEQYLGYVNSFKKWVNYQVKKFILIEKRFTNEHFEYNGQIDYLIEGQDGKIYICDLKTSKRKNNVYRVQMAAYRELLKSNKHEVEAVILVYLNKDGEYPDIDFLEDLAEEWDVFRAALECYNYFHKKEKKNGD